MQKLPVPAPTETCLSKHSSPQVADHDLVEESAYAAEEESSQHERVALCARDVESKMALLDVDAMTGAALEPEPELALGPVLELGLGLVLEPELGLVPVPELVHELEPVHGLAPALALEPGLTVRGCP